MFSLCSLPPVVSEETRGCFVLCTKLGKEVDGIYCCNTWLVGDARTLNEKGVTAAVLKP